MEKIISEFPEYSVDENGKVTKITNGYILKKQLTKNGYQQVTLYNEYGRKVCYVHRLVAAAFIPNPNNYSDVNHIDYDKTNNSVSNLEWCSRSSNLKHSYGFENRDKNREHAKELAAENHEKVKIPVYQKDLQGNILATYSSVAEAANTLGIAASSISAATLGKRPTAGGYKWSRVDGSGKEMERKRPPRCAVQQLDLEGNVINTFSSMTEAERITGVGNRSISEVCSGRNKTAGGYKWNKIENNAPNNGD